MSIEFITEDGTGKTTATSYLTVAEFRQYWTNRGTVYPTDTPPATAEDDKIKAYLNSATEFIDITFRFKGIKVDEDQALEFPRYGVMRRNGRLIDSDIVPVDIKNACAYLAGMKSEIELNVVENNIRSESYGPVSKAYAGGSSISFPYISKLLSDYVVSGNAIIRVN